ncbi:type 4a pilus biogenesis protein PilO [Pontiella agarivorans]|uniref:Type 4a pilus biogenesis protein PilO n=1 Tax=Pontiella agarivorans TaxID=3038953 RepID=A0ABU5MUG7_9BACT|nr:type 4a pilus biogenesis protein PilO [Pontiella agarivorans]MDZ8117860.1 type 4a pilus biogenesis protein PilO [Pontiella agarivorans]
MKISQREMVLGVATLALIMGGLTYVVIHKKMAVHRTNKTKIENLRQQILLDEARIRMQQNWIEELNELQKDLRVFNTEQKSVSPELMKTVNTIAGKHGLHITRSQPRTEKPTGDLFELPINCVWDGELEALVDFLTELQQQGVRYDVRSLTAQPAGKNSGKLKGNIVIHCVYTRKPGGALKNPPEK